MTCLCESRMRENCTSGLSGGRGPALRRAPSDPTPEKRANKVGQPAAESVEGRGSTKGNATQTLLAPDSEPGKRGIGLWGVRAAAKRDKRS